MTDVRYLDVGEKAAARNALHAVLADRTRVDLDEAHRVVLAAIAASSLVLDRMATVRILGAMGWRKVQQAPARGRGIAYARAAA